MSEENATKNTDDSAANGGCSPVLCSAGHDRLWTYFGLSYASWLTLPRVMCHQMPDEWQEKMAALMEEWDETWTNQPDFGTRVQITKGGKLCAMPDWLKNYRHPDKRIFDDMKQNTEDSRERSELS